MFCRSVRASGSASKRIRTGRVVPAVTVSSSSLVPGVCVPMRNTVERPRRVSEKRRSAVRFRRACTGISIRRRISPGARMFWLLPVTKSRASTVRTEPSAAHSSYRASRATVSVIMGPAGRDIQILPPTVAALQTLNEERNASQLRGKSGPALHSSGSAAVYSSWMVQVAPTPRPVSPGTRGSQGSAVRSIRRRSSGCSTEKSQVPPASQASPARQSAPGRPDGRRRTSVTVVRSMGIDLPHERTGRRGYSRSG